VESGKKLKPQNEIGLGLGMGQPQ